MKEPEVSLKEINILKHTVGNNGRSKPGWRNYYCGNPEDPILNRLVKKGLLRRNDRSDSMLGGNTYFHATEKGMEIGSL